MTKMVAEQVMKSKFRYYDEKKHERPLEYINLMSPILRDQNKREFEKESNVRRPKKEGLSSGLLRLVVMVEMLRWGDAGQYLCTPDPASGCAAIKAIRTPEQKAQFLKKFAECGQCGAPWL